MESLAIFWPYFVGHPWIILDLISWSLNSIDAEVPKNQPPYNF